MLEPLFWRGKCPQGQVESVTRGSLLKETQFLITVLLVTTRWQHAIIYLAMSVWVVVSSVPSTSLPKLNIGK